MDETMLVANLKSHRTNKLIIINTLFLIHESAKCGTMWRNLDTAEQQNKIRTAFDGAGGQGSRVASHISPSRQPHGCASLVAPSSSLVCHHITSTITHHWSVAGRASQSDVSLSSPVRRQRLRREVVVVVVVPPGRGPAAPWPLSASEGPLVAKVGPGQGRDDLRVSHD